ncbi:HAMP domain-containing protein [Noviherbaspirillum sp.]|uniref:HAMP domain-containing protein n=1 Tax=Noviherbaspirillum sp. TaxID=1926288 RepID=UPI0039C9E7C1
MEHIETGMLDRGVLLQTLIAVRDGDFSARLPVDWEGMDGRIADAFNEIVSSNERVARSIEQVSFTVGTEGQLGQRIVFDNYKGAWGAKVSAVNTLIDRLVQPVRDAGRVIGAVARGVLTENMELEVEGRPLKGEFLKNAKTINTMLDQLNSFSSEVTRVAREVGTEGKLGGQAEVPGVAGVWKDLTDNVNAMAGNLTVQLRDVSKVATAIAMGDLGQKITVDVRGEILQIKDVINSTVDQLNGFAGEVTRVAREVGTEGKLGGQAEVRGVAGVWKDLTDNVNAMAGNLTVQLRDVSKVATAIANGDLTQKITVDVKGEILQIKDVINTMVDQLNSFAGEVTRVAREVGTEGKLGGQAQVPGIAGTWKDLTDNVNAMASNLTVQLRDVSKVATAIASGDLGQKITVDVKGEILQIKNVINTMVDQLNSFAGEVTRVAREVGSEGKLGVQAAVPGVAGIWKDLTDNVNAMAGNLTVQLRDVSKVATAIANGDLGQKITVDVKGEILQIKDVINTMVDQLNSFAGEVTRVAREVGTEGNLGGQALVPGIGGTWKDLTDSVNLMASNLTAQVRNIAAVTTAVANGDLSQTITVDVKGEILELKNTINIMVDQLNSFAGEVTRVAREVGIEGRLGGQAQVKGVSGVWRGLTDNVNLMASNLTDQVRGIATVTTAVANGDLSKKITVDVRGEVLQLKETINTMVDQLNGFAGEVTRVAREVGTEGRLGGQAYVPAVAGVWKDLTDNVNLMATNLTAQVRNIAAVTTAVANGDLSRKITVDVKGEILELKNTINIMVDQLNAFGSEVTRVAREVGTEGKLGGQANVKGISGIWKDLTDSVNLMADNLTDQVRGIAKVVTAVAVGNLKQKMMVPAKGEVASLAETINNMVDTLATFSDQVTRVAREVGVEGRLGGQAVVPGAAGSWKDLVDNVNELAANLTTQVRAIGEVATAVTKGDLTRSIQVIARGEVADLKDNINQMIRNLRETTQRNTEQDWLKTNLARLTRMLQGQRDIITMSRTLLSELAPLVGSQHAVLYVMQSGQNNPLHLKLMASYGYQERKNLSNEWSMGEGVVGQAAFEKQRILMTNLPDDYIQIVSGLGQAAPRNIVVLPILFEGQVKAVIELAAFERFQAIHLNFLDQLAEGLGIVFNSIETASRTEALLQQSQSLANELKSQQDELQKTNAELEQKARQLSEQNAEVERKNREIEIARSNLQEKAEQLSLTSKYKSEFLANMSHELRTPLNSLLLLAEQLRQNPESNLSSKQLEMVKVIHSAGSELLHLINDILDLSKIESGSATLSIEDVPMADISEHVERTFRHLAEVKGLAFGVEFAPDLPAMLHTDAQRLKQVLTNLLSNAIKFTSRGSVTISAHVARSGWSSEHKVLSHAPQVIAFSVADTGIGIPEDKQRLIFEAFQQADASTSRRYGGTGLGLAISREIAHLLGGELQVNSREGEGSAFTFYLPQQWPDGTEARIESKAPPKPQADKNKEPPQRPRAPQLRSVPTGEASATVPQTVFADDRTSLTPQDNVLLIIEDDPVFARALQEMAHDRGFKTLVTPSGEEGLALARRHRPDAITLDLNLPDLEGWDIVDQLKAVPTTREIPIHIISVRDRPASTERFGIASYLAKPVDVATLAQVFSQIMKEAHRPIRALLVVENDPMKREAILNELKGADVELDAVSNAGDARVALQSRPYQGIVLDLDLPDMDGQAFLKEIRDDHQLTHIPVVIYTGRPLDRSTEDQLRQMGATVVAEGARSLDRLVVETEQFLQRIKTGLSERKRAMLEQLAPTSHLLEGKKVLLVDDDVRNLFALTGLLEDHGMTVVTAENGRQALEQLEQASDVDIILMDIMMPEMDGYETIGRIRSNPRFQDVPIIALTAKAMKGDREKCIDAGASDYASKPIDSEQLLSQLKLWLFK